MATAWMETVRREGQKQGDLAGAPAVIQVGEDLRVPAGGVVGSGRILNLFSR